MYNYPESLQSVIELLKKIPGIGFKSAQRIAFHLLKMPTQDVEKLGESITSLKTKLFFCSRCNNITDEEVCPICKSSEREKEKLCIVEQPYNLYSIEKTGVYKGSYFVLLGSLSPLKGVGPEDLHLDKLDGLINENNVKEVIIATNPNVEGEATSMFLKNYLSKYPNIKITKLSVGLPIGSDIDYTDEITLLKAFEKRYEM
jgi:recombination protein RecR